MGRRKEQAGYEKKAVCYVRVSTDEQVRGGVSLDDQEAKLLAYCSLNDLEVIAILREEGVSGAKTLATRPCGAEVARLINSRQAGHVVALKLDRLFRDAADALTQTKTWDRMGVALHLVDLGGQSLNTASAMGRFFLSMMAGIAELERSLISERTAAAMMFKKHDRQAYSPTPFGFDRVDDHIIPNSHEAVIISLIRQWRRDGQSLGRIATELNARAIPAKRGGRWFTSTVSYILRNNLYDRLDLNIPGNGL